MLFMSIIFVYQHMFRVHYYLSVSVRITAVRFRRELLCLIHCHKGKNKIVIHFFKSLLGASLVGMKNECRRYGYVQR